MTTTPFPISAATSEGDLNAFFLEELVRQAPPLLKEGLFLAAIPFRYDATLLGAIRQREDGKDEKLVARLAQFSFIVPLSTQADGLDYAVHAEERIWLQTRWLGEDAVAYRAAHQYAASFWRDTPPDVTDPFTITQNLIYHTLIANPTAGMEQLIAAFRDLSADRRLAAIDRLLTNVAEAQDFLERLQDPASVSVDEVMLYLRARLAQLRGRWEASKAVLDALLDKPALSPLLRPFVRRAYGITLVQTDQYVEGMELLEQAHKEMVARKESDIEQGYTMLALGDANVGLALAARGYYADANPPQTTAERWRRYLPLLPIPLMIYLSARGLNFWHPYSWQAMKSQDWIVARLLGRGAKWYRRADAKLEQDGAGGIWGQADEKLAWLYLTMGDPWQAASRFREVLSDPTNEEFRHASAHIGLARCLWQLGQGEEAEQMVTKALPVVEVYEAADLSAMGEELLGKIAERHGKGADAVQRYGRALWYYQLMGDTVHATAIAEALEKLSADPAPQVQEAVTLQLDVANTILPTRVYPARFQHTLLKYFQWGMAGVVMFLLFVLPMLAVRLQQGPFLQYAIGFQAEPPIRAGISVVPPTAEPTFNAGVIPIIVPNTAFSIAIAVAVGVIVLYTLLGIYLIASTNFASLQRATKAQLLKVSKRGVTQGDDPFLEWDTVTQTLQADTYFNGETISVASVTSFSDGTRRLDIRGSTAFYEPLRTRLLQQVPKTAKRRVLESHVWPSRMGWWYLISFILVIVLGALSTVSAISAPLSTDLLFTPYSVLDLYPFLFTGLIVPPLWWMAAQPLRVLATLNSYRTAALVVVAGILVLTVAYQVARLQVWFLQPNFYGPLATLLLGVALVDAVLRAGRRELPSPPPESPRLMTLATGLIAVVGMITVAISILTIVLTVASYHFAQVGNSALDAFEGRVGCEEPPIDAPDNATAKIPCPDDLRLSAAQAAFGTARTLDDDNPLAWRGLGATYLQQKRYNDALQSFNHVIRLEPRNGYYIADRAVAYATWSYDNVARAERLEEAGNTEEGAALREAAKARHLNAIEDFNIAINRDADNADLYLWRGMAYHAIEEAGRAREDYLTVTRMRPNDPRPYTNLGWLSFQRATLFMKMIEESRAKPDRTDEDIAQEALLLQRARAQYQEALTFFEQARTLTPSASADLVSVIGYTKYQLGEYEAAFEEWDNAVQLAPEDPTMYNLRATALWRLGTWNNGVPGELCSSTTIDPAVKQQKTVLLERSLADFERVATLTPDDDFNFRTIGQIHYLLRDCPGHDGAEERRQAIASYGKAIELAPDALAYRQFHVRLTYSLFLVAYQPTPAQYAEFHGYVATACQDWGAIQRIDPESNDNVEVLRRLREMVEWQLAAERAAQDDMLAVETYRCLLQIDPTATRFFEAGFFALNAGDEEAAEQWYRQGMAIAEGTLDTVALDQAIQSLIEFSRQQPTVPPTAQRIFDDLVTRRRALD